MAQKEKAKSVTLYLRFRRLKRNCDELATTVHNSLDKWNLQKEALAPIRHARDPHDDPRRQIEQPLHTRGELRPAQGAGLRHSL